LMFNATSKLEFTNNDCESFVFLTLNKHLKPQTSNAKRKTIIILVLVILSSCKQIQHSHSNRDPIFNLL